MANTSILAAFERMWYHIVALVGNKADVEHTHKISGVENLQDSLDAKVPTIRTINGKALTDDITLTASDIGALSGDVEIPALDEHANNKSNPHEVTAEQVGLGNVDNVKQYSASNPPPYPVTSVNGATGAITVNTIPNYTTANNGQFLRVIDGAVAWSALPNAEEASF